MSNPSQNPLQARLSRWSILDSALAWVVASVGAVAAVALLFVPHFFIPAEDAVILFQYSRNLAETGAITFIAHGPRTEGATDFAWMVLLSLGMKLHIAPFWFIAVLNAAAILLLGVLLVKIAGARVKPLPVLFIAGSFALIPQIFAAAAGFSTLPFACLLVLLAFCFQRGMDIATPMVALVLCLFRPDGVVFAVPLLVAALIFEVEPERRMRRLRLDTACFALPGLAYFIWRWQYFRQLLPLPFLVKSDAHRFAHLFVLSSIRQGKIFYFFALAVLIFALRGTLRDARTRSLLLCLVVLPNLFYCAMRLDQNIASRFFIFIPAGVAVLLAVTWPSNRPRAAMLLRIGLFAWVFFLARAFNGEWQSLLIHQFDNRKAVAEDLATLPPGVAIVTEAGIVPFYSHWQAYDAWGLNTPQFAERLLQPSDVVDLHPDFVLVYTGGDIACTAQQDWRTPYTERTWQHLTRNVIAGAAPPAYNLWLLPSGSSRHRAMQHMATWQGDQECWLVRQNSPLHSDIEAILARHRGLTLEQYRTLVPSSAADRPEQADTAPTPHTLRSVLETAWHWSDN